MPVRVEADGAVTVQHDDTFASLRVVPVDEGLELISLSQILAWDLTPDRRIRARVAKHARTMTLGTVVLLDKKDHADVMLRYNFPGTGLSDDALRTLILMVLSSGVDVRESIML
ncbi:MAG: hypothetical protein JO152_04765 [Mycobacteriaceae bacterium]|nr:hypothetical protein [Mycobacteriaceae bacterium]